MAIRWLTPTILLAIFAMPLSSCDDEKDVASKGVIGDQVLSVEYRLGRTWGGGYSVRVFPEEYLVLEHRNCGEARRALGKVDDPAVTGLCAIRVDKSSSNRFEAALKPFRRYAIPLKGFSIADGAQRPDRKRCKNRVTDHDQISVVWVTTAGAEIAAFDAGCDRQEFDQLYASLRRVTESLPINTIIDKR